MPQIFHSLPENKPYEKSRRASDFVKRCLKKAVALESDASVLRFGCEAVRLKGAYVELGVFSGRTINFIAALNPEKTIYGFDSFEGLPVPWVCADRIYPAGMFKMESLPVVLGNVKLVKGLFIETLPKFAETLNEPIAFLHVDCDLYSSTMEAFFSLRKWIVPGTVMVFDEFYNYAGFENHELQAFEEFLDESGYEVDYLAYNRFHEQVALRLALST